MSDLNSHIDTASKFQLPPAQDAPIVDQSSNAAFALNLVQRQAAERAAAPTPEPPRSIAYMPIPN